MLTLGIRLVNHSLNLVNEIVFMMKNKILAFLTDHPGIVSGQAISNHLGISRVAIWKHIHNLRREGIKIEPTPKGYRLHELHDIPLPFRFGERAERIHYFPEMQSTMIEAMQMARKGCPDFTIVITECQTKGRGRLQREWISDRGGLYFTIVLRPEIELMNVALIHLSAAIDLALILREFYGINAGVKWPNDILFGPRKVAGLLAQMEAELDYVSFVNIGIGINVNNNLSDDLNNATTIAQILGQSISRVDLLSHFLNRFEYRIKKRDFQSVIEEWKQLSLTIGKEVAVQTSQETVKGKAIDIDEHGGLVIELSNGNIRTVVHGDCFHEVKAL
jgi:BirA family biotin operon repressor/biotin-[acetyl-CoA-carboxylase] ligase